MLTGNAITVDFTYTKKDEIAKHTSGVFIDYNGAVTGSGSRILIRGGDDTDTYTKTNYIPSPFYITASQRVSLMRLLKSLASRTDTAIITSPNGDLQEIAYAIYRNYC